MRRASAIKLGWSAWLGCVALAGFQLTLTVLSIGVDASGPDASPSAADAVGSGVYFVAVAAFATVGAFVIQRRPGNSVGCSSRLAP